MKNKKETKEQVPVNAPDMTLDVLQEMERNLARLKLAFKAGLDEMGEITKQDIDYNIDIVSRLMNKKFGQHR
jgi:hypothetical protein